MSQPTVPAATRVRRPGWRDPRIWVGLAIVALCVVLGSMVMASADDTVQVWVATRDLPAGTRVSSGDLEPRHVHFADGDVADRYLDAAPSGTVVLDRPVAAGELVPRSAVHRRTGAPPAEVPLSVGADDLPATVHEGSVVDVWVAPEQGTGAAGDPSAGRARLVLEHVTVVALPHAADRLAPQASRQVIVGVPAGRAGDLGEALGALASGRVVVVGTGA